MLQKRTVAITALAVFAALLLIAGGAVGHGDDTGHDHDEAPVDGTAEEWAEWMEDQMNEHMGADAAKQMQDHMGMDYEEMGQMMEGRMDGDGGMTGENGSGMECH